MTEGDAGDRAGGRSFAMVAPTGGIRKKKKK